VVAANQEEAERAADRLGEARPAGFFATQAAGQALKGRSWSWTWSRPTPTDLPSWWPCRSSRVWRPLTWRPDPADSEQAIATATAVLAWMALLP
jgi:hypothetical protein